MLAPESWRCILPLTGIRQWPRPDAELASELLFGEFVRVVNGDGDWAFVTALRDDYTGWVSGVALLPAATEPSHLIADTSGLVFARADIKSPLLQRLYLNSPLVLSKADADFYQLETGGFIHHRHVVARSALNGDPVAVGMRFLGTPYLWGGRTCDGMDCSGLVQTALHACGIACPRDTGDQRASFTGSAISGTRQRGDIVFFPGHVGIMVDATQLLHANAYWMSTVIEPLASVVDRLRPHFAEPILSIVRLT